MIKKLNLATLRFIYRYVDFIVIAIIFVLTNIPAMGWEMLLIGISWEDEWKVRIVSTVIDIAFSWLYVLIRNYLLKNVPIQNVSKKEWVVDTMAILLSYTILKVVKFYIFSKIGWVTMDGLWAAIWSIIIFSVLFGHKLGKLIDRTREYLRIKIKTFLEGKIGYALLRSGAKHFLLRLEI